MSIEVFLTPSVQYVINDIKSVMVEGKTVVECLENLTQQYPRLMDLIFDDKRRLRNNLNIFLNGESIASQGLAQPVGEGDKINIVDVIIGG